MHTEDSGRKVRGLDLGALGGMTPEEIRAHGQFYEQNLGHKLNGLEFWAEHDAETLKRYRLFTDLSQPGMLEDNKRPYIFGFLPFYAIIGYDLGVRYVIRIRQNLGMSKEQVLEGLAITFLVAGPAGMENIARALKDYEWITPKTPAVFPEGWAPDPDAFKSGLDFSQTMMLDGELEMLQDWYRRVLGEVPPYVRFLGRHRPDLLKAMRGRWENCLRLLPKQFMPTTMLHYDVIRGFEDGIRENVLLARAFGVSKHITLNAISSALNNAGTSGASIVERAAGDIFDMW